jgi:hypothetical protein
MVRLLIEAEELIFDRGHTLSEMRHAFASHSIAGNKCDCREVVPRENSFPAILDDDRECENGSKPTIECAVWFRLEVTRTAQDKYATSKENDRPNPRLGLERQ